MHGCGWDSGAASALLRSLAASVASRYELGADGVGAARPGARGSRVTAERVARGSDPAATGGSLPRATRSAPKAGALRARAPTCAPRVTAHVVSWGWVGMSKTSCAARCSRGSVQGVLRAPAEGEGAGGTPRGPCCHRLRHTRAEHRYGGSWQEGGARAASPPLQGLAPPARRGRRVRVPRAFKRPVKTLCGGGGGAHTNSELPQAGFP